MKTNEFYVAEAAEAFPRLSEAAGRISEKVAVLQDQLTEEQLTTAIAQAISCGDFITLVAPTKSVIRGDDLSFEIRQTVVYLPYDGYERECEKFKRYQKTVAGILTPEQRIQLENLLGARYEDAL